MKGRKGEGKTGMGNAFQAPRRAGAKPQSTERSCTERAGWRIWMKTTVAGMGKVRGKVVQKEADELNKDCIWGAL